MTRRRTPKTLRACLCWLVLTATSPVFAEKDPPMRTGLWVTQKISEAAANLSAFEATIRGNPHLSGVSIHAGWNEVRALSQTWSRYTGLRFSTGRSVGANERDESTPS